MRRRVISILMVLVMLLTMLPTTAVAAMFEEEDYAATVYVNGSSGNNSNSGTTDEDPVKTMTVAYEKLYALMDAAGKKTDPDSVGRIVVTGDVSFSTTNGPTPNNSTYSGGENHVFTVLVTGQTSDVGMNIKLDYNNLGPTVYENITLTKHNDSENLTYFCANGYPLTIGEGVTCVAKSNGYHFNLVGGKKTADYFGDSDLTVQSGSWRNVYVGNYKGNMTGTAKLTMTGGSADNTIAASYNGNHSGDVYISITGGDISGIVYGGNSYTSGSQTGNIYMTISDVTVDGNVVAGGRLGLTGDLSLNLQDTIVTGSISTQCTGTVDVNLTASEGETLSINAGDLDVTTFTGGGDLIISANTKLNVGEVTGSTKLTIDGAPFNMAYITAPESAADDAFVYVPSGEETMGVSVSGGAKRWTISGGKALSALKVTAPEDVSFSLHVGFGTDGTEIVPDAATTEDGITTYVFDNLAAGTYCYSASGTGYYKIKKNIYYSEAEAAEGQTIDANPGLLAEDAFQQTSQIVLHTDEVMSTILNSDPDQELWKDYRHVFDTPVFADGRAAHQQTTQDQMMDFLAELDGESDKMYTYIAGTTPVYNYEIPVVVFSNTDLSGADTLEEAAELVRANGKPTIHYQGMIHPNEPAGGEGTLAMIKALDGTYGAEILDQVNIYVIPRINGDGAHVYQRANVAQSIDMNRDHLYVQSKEVAIVHHIYNQFMPEVTIDGHEFTSSASSTSATLDDVQVGTAGNLNSGEDFTKYSQAIVQETFKAAKSLGLRPYNYGDYASTVNNAIGRPYYALYGSLSFLIETRGIGSGLGWMERRVLSQYVVAEAIIDYVAANAETIKKTSTDERQRLVTLGGVFGEEDDVLVLEHGVTKENYYEIDRPSWNLTDGSLVSAGTGKKVYYYDKIVSSRARPTAYVMSKDAANIDKIVANMDKNGITYYELDADSTVMLQQYKGNQAAATLTSETAVTFENGAYVFPMNQVAANVLAMTMEPDVVDSEGYNGTLLQSGLVAPDANGMIAIYRYSHDLVDGKVSLVQVPDAPQGLSVVHPTEAFGTGSIIGLDSAKAYEYRAEGDAAYTVLPVGTTEITGLKMGAYYVRYAASGDDPASRDCKLDVIDSNITSYVIYVDSVNGSDEATGYTEATAVKTIAAGYNALGTLVKYAPEGTEGTIVLLSDVTFSGTTQLPTHTYPVLLTSATGAEGLVSGSSFGFNGPTRLEDMSITLTAKELRYIAANGNKLVIGENVNTVPAGSYYFNLAGGGNTNEVEGDVDLTVHSGTFRNIYAAGYKGNVTGNVKLTMTGGATTAVIQTSYSGATNGNVTMDLSNVTIGGKLFGGNTSSKNVNGDVTIILGEGVTAKTDVYAGSRDAGSVAGNVSIIVDGADVKGTVYGGCANSTGSVESCTVTLKSGTLSKPVQADDIILNTAGGKTLTLSGSIEADEVIGGGTVVIPNSAVISAAAASGVTLVEIDGTADETAYYVTAPTTVSADAFTCTCVEGKTFVTQDTEGQRYWYLGIAEPELPENPQDPETPNEFEEQLAIIKQAVEDLLTQIDAYIKDQAERLEDQFCKQLDAAIAELEAQLKDLETQLKDLETQLKNASEELNDAIEAEINAAIDAVEAQIAEAEKALEALKQAYLDAITGEYVAGCDSYYVALGDVALLPIGDSYADILADELDVAYANLADAALTTAGIEDYIAANAEEIAKADLITVSLGSNDISGFVLEQLEAYINGADTTIDWAALNLDATLTSVLTGTLDEIHARLAKELADTETVDLMGLAKVDPAELISLAADSYLYGALSFSLNFAPALNAIHAANPEAQVVIVGMSNPFEAIVEMMGIEDLDVNAILDTVAGIADLELLVYTMLTANTTFVAAPDAASNLRADAQLGGNQTLVFDLAFQTSEAGHAYIAECILNALTIEKKDHVYGEWISISDTEHQRTCTLCGDAFETGSHADANSDHICDVCDAKISDCADANNDHKCDICGTELSTCADANNDHKCDICGTELSTCADANNDHKCDVCGEAVSEHADANNDHKCDVCGDTVSEHTDANGDNKCDVCDKDLTPEHTHVFSGYKYDKDNHWKECECGHIIEKAAHTFAGNTCKICGYEKQSSGGGGGGGSSKPSIDPTPAPAPAPAVNPFIDVNTGDYFYNAILWAAQKNITTGMTDTLFAPNGVCTRAQMVTFLWRAMGSPAPKTASCSFVDVSADAYYYDAVLWGTENGIVKGTSETTFSPDQTVTRSQTVTFLWRNAGAPKTTAACAFTDIAEGAYYYDAVLWAAEQQITKGTSATTFSPEDPCLRGQIVTFLYNYMAD